jgi:hypothetical protein
MKKLIASTFLLLLALSCDNKGIPVDLPSCIQDQIKTVALNDQLKSVGWTSVNIAKVSCYTNLCKNLIKPMDFSIC